MNLNFIPQNKSLAMAAAETKSIVRSRRWYHLTRSFQIRSTSCRVFQNLLISRMLFNWHIWRYHFSIHISYLMNYAVLSQRLNIPINTHLWAGLNIFILAKRSKFRICCADAAWLLKFDVKMRRSLSVSQHSSFCDNMYSYWTVSDEAALFCHRSAPLHYSRLIRLHRIGEIIQPFIYISVDL